MPYVSRPLAKANKKAEKEEKRQDMKETKKVVEEQRKVAEEAEKIRLAEENEKKRREGELKEKKEKRKQEKKEKEETEKSQKESEKRQQELEERKVKRGEELAKLMKTIGAKDIAEKIAFERLGYQVMTTEISSGQNSKILKAKKGDNEIIVKMFPLEKLHRSYSENLKKEGFRILRFIGGDGGQPKTPQFIRVLDIFAIQTKVYVFMDECLRVSIHTRLRNKDTITEENAKSWSKQLCEAIDYMQLSGIAHRNIRTENILFDKDYKIKLVGFGMACIFWDNEKQEIITKRKEKPQPKEIKLSDHLPPEALQSDPYDPSSVDIWSLGVIICILLNKVAPFDLKSSQSFEEQWTQYSAKFQFTEEAKQLLNRIFVSDVNNRIKSEEVLRDLWITNAKPNQTPNPVHI